MLRTLIVALLCCGPFVGCNVTRDLTHVLIKEPLHFPINIDHYRTKHANRRMARASLAGRLNDHDPAGNWWALMPFLAAHHGLPVAPDYAAGYLEGFTDNLTYGGAGLPPIAPPRKYWRLKYANPAGRDAIQAWFTGFTDGSADAMLSGYREARLIPVSMDAGVGVLQRDAPPIPEEEQLPPPAIPGFGDPDFGTPVESELPPIPFGQLTPENIEAQPTPAVHPALFSLPRNVPQTPPVHSAVVRRLPLITESTEETPSPPARVTRMVPHPRDRIRCCRHHQASRENSLLGPFPLSGRQSRNKVSRLRRGARGKLGRKSRIRPRRAASHKRETPTAKNTKRDCAESPPELLSGCASITNSVANGIPVALLSPDLLAEPKDDKVTIPLEWLRQPRPDAYLLAPGDILGVFIDGVLGDREQLPPFNLPGGDLPPALGFPVPVVEDGSILLPFVDPIYVQGLSIKQAREAVIKAYTVDNEILGRPEDSRILVTLTRPRNVRVLVLRQDSPESALTVRSNGPLNQAGLGGFEISRGQTRGTGTVVSLPACENDVLNALTRTGGLPGLDAVNEVVIRRGGFREGIETGIDWEDSNQITRIRMRLRPGTPRPFEAEDVILKDGDIVLIQERIEDVYYTAGLLPTAEVPLPRDADLAAVEAVIRARGLLFRGATGGNNLNGNIAAGGVGDPSPSMLTIIRRADDGRLVPIRVNLYRAVRDPRENILVQKGDILVLQWTPGEAIAKYFKDIISIGFNSTLFSRRDASATGTFGLP